MTTKSNDHCTHYSDSYRGFFKKEYVEHYSIIYSFFVFVRHRFYVYGYGCLCAWEARHLSGGTAPLPPLTRRDCCTVYASFDNHVLVIVSEGVERVKNDIDKIVLLCKSLNVDIQTNDISSTHRLGRRRDNGPRALKIQMKAKDNKYKLLNKRREILKSENLLKIFGHKIFVNPDQSFLVQREELRLRQESEFYT